MAPWDGRVRARTRRRLRGRRAEGYRRLTYIEVNKARLWVEEEGSGPAVLFLHGGLGDSRLWKPEACALAEDFRCVRFDLRFYGRSRAPAEEWSTLDDVRGVLDALAIERAAVVGLSLGGGIALDFALAYPERVWALAHVAAPITGVPLRLSEQHEAAYAAAQTPEDEMRVDFEVWAPLGVDDTIQELWHATPEARGGLPEGARPQPRPDADLGRLGTPTLAIIAKHDPPGLQDAARLLPNAQLVEVDSDHYLTLRKPDLVTRLLKEFLQDRRPQ